MSVSTAEEPPPTYCGSAAADTLSYYAFREGEDFPFPMSVVKGRK
jgi:hypothetical protein